MRYLLRRIAFYVVALWASVTLNFALPRLMPGDPAEAYLTRLQGSVSLSPATIAAIKAQYGLSNDPVYVQYFQYMVNLLHGNLGQASSQSFQPVVSVIAGDIPWTLSLVGIATILSFVIGTLLGVLAAWKRGGGLDSIVVPIATFFSAIPYFWLALGFIWIFSTQLGWFPNAYGFDTYNIEFLNVQGFNPDYIWSVITHGFLPALTILVSSFAGWMLAMRNTMLTTLSEDYVLMARAKGLTNNRVMFLYAARNAILPSITGFGLALGYVIAGSLLTEIVFSYPGIGYALYKAITQLDYNMIEGVFLFIAIAILLANLLSEVALTFLDPRVRHERG
jgi:peptide/nickel transport system permease protein